MKPADRFPRLLHAFFQERMVQQRNASVHTVRSRKRTVAQLTFTDLTAHEVSAFLHHTEQERGDTIGTRNCRLAALRSFFGFVAGREPAAIAQCAEILRIPTKRAPIHEPCYLEPEEVKAILAAEVEKVLFAGHPAIAGQEAGDRDLHVDVDGGRVHQDVLQAANQLQAGSVADVGEPGIGVRAERPLMDQSVPGAVEDGSPALQFEHPLRRLLGVDLSHAPVVDQLAALHRVREVPLPAVQVSDVAQGRRHPALGHDRVGLAKQRLADQPDRDTGVRRFDGGAQSGAARPDHQDVVRVG